MGILRREIPRFYCLISLMIFLIWLWTLEEWIHVIGNQRVQPLGTLCLRFDPEMRSWSESIVLDPGQPVNSYHIGCSNDGLILIGVSEIRDIEGVKVWRVNGEYFQCEEIGEMPMEYVEELKSESWDLLL